MKGIGYKKYDLHVPIISNIIDRKIAQRHALFIVRFLVVAFGTIIFCVAAAKSVPTYASGIYTMS